MILNPGEPEDVEFTIQQPQVAEVYRNVCGLIDQHNRIRHDDVKFEKNVEVCTAQKSTQGSFGWRRRRRRKRVKLADISTWLCPIDQLRSIGTKFHEEIGKYGACGGVQGRVCSALQCAHAMGWKGMCARL